MKQSDDGKVQKAKRAFFVSLFDLSWRMLGAMLLPIFIGMFIDSRIGHGQVFSLIGFLVGIAGGVFIIRSIVRKLSGRGDV